MQEQEQEQEQEQVLEYDYGRARSARNADQKSLPSPTFSLPTLTPTPSLRKDHLISVNLLSPSPSTFSVLQPRVQLCNSSETSGTTLQGQQATSNLKGVQNSL